MKRTLITGARVRKAEIIQLDGQRIGARVKRIFTRKPQGRTRKRSEGEMRKWLTGGAVVVIIAVAVAIACYGHWRTLGPIAWLAIPFTIGIEIFAARAAIHWASAAPGKRAALALLALLCVGVSAIFEHRGIEAINSDANATHAAAISERARALEIKGELETQYNALPALPADPVALAQLPTRTANRIEAARAQWMDARPLGENTPTNYERLERARAIAATPLPTQAAHPLTGDAIAFMVAFILLFKLAGFWAISPGSAELISFRQPAPAPPAPVQRETPAPNVGRALANARWEKHRAAKAVSG